MTIKAFEDILARAKKRKGVQFEELLPGSPPPAKHLAQLGSDRCLSELTKAVFKAGFVWRVIDKKWPGFEEAFWNFNVNRCAYMSFEDMEELVQDKRIIRNRPKIQTVQANATVILELEEEYAEEYDSFPALLAYWPSERYHELLKLLNKRGQRLGAMTAQYALRFLGRDGYVLGRDVVAALIDAGVIDKSPSSQKAMQQVQDAFNSWHEETGLNYSTLSRVLALSIDA